MSSTDDEQLNKNAALFIFVRENKSVTEKIENISKCLQRGANVNAMDGNDKNNTPLHIAVRRSEADVVRFLVDNGAECNVKNSQNETPVAIALKLNTNNKSGIIDSLQSNITINSPVIEIPSNVPQASASKKKATTNSQKKAIKYLKRTGTSGVYGQLYETKLLTLTLVKALNDADIEMFLLGTNISDIGDMDDICLRFRVKGNPKPIVLFVQAKHKENGRITVEDVRSPKGDYSVRKYFDSYLIVKERFHPNNKDAIFEGEFEDVQCYFVIYTPAVDLLVGKKTDTKVNKTIHNLIYTGKKSIAVTKTDPTAADYGLFQINHGEVSDDIDILAEMTVIDRIKKLGTLFLQFILAKSDKSEVLKTTKLITRYHVMLAREVLQLSRSQEPLANRILWRFQPNFFTRDCKYLNALRTTFFNDLSSTRCDNTQIVDADRHNFEDVLLDPCAVTISKLIGKLAKYNAETKKLEIFELKDFKKKFASHEYKSLIERFNQIQTEDNVIKEAVTRKLEAMEIKLPVWFGNLDMTLRDAKREVTLASELVKLFKLNKHDKVVEIKEAMVGPGRTIEKGVIDINGGIGGAVGNLLVFDTETKMLKFEVNNTALPTRASSFLNELVHQLENEDLSSYKIKVNIDGFPKDSFYADEYDKRQARDFLSKLWFYPDQAKEAKVEEVIKDYIKEYYNKEKDQFRIHSDAIFLKSHHEVQKWWLRTGEVEYLNETNEYFELAKQAVIHHPLLTILHSMYNLKVQNIGIRFIENAIYTLNLNAISKRVFNVITDATILTGTKIMQYFKTKGVDYTFVDFDYVLSLPLNDYNTLLQELKQKDVGHLVLIYEKLKYYEGLCNKLKEIIQQLHKESKIILVTERSLANEIRDYAGDKYQSVIDDKTYLIDLDDSSQTKILENSTVVFQGQEMPLKRIQYDTVDNRARTLITTDILYRLINKEKLEIGHVPINETHNDETDSFEERTLRGNETCVVNSFHDIEDTVVVISGRTEKSKSTLLNALSINTKLIHPLPWIVRVNLPAHEKVFIQWQAQSTGIEDIHEPLILHFLCSVTVKNISIMTKTTLNYHAGIVSVGQVDEDINPLALFELEMFLYLYNLGMVIFLFDDFNAITSHFEVEVTRILKLLKDDGKRMWVTTGPYKHTKKTLEKELDVEPYKLKPHKAPEERIVSLNNLYSINRKLEQLNYELFEYARDFLKGMSKVTNARLVSDPEREVLPLFALPIHFIYVLAVQFLESDINRASASTLRSKVRENFKIDLDKYTPLDQMLGRTPEDDELELAEKPLHLYLIDKYLRFRLEESISLPLGNQEARNKWDLILKSFMLYRQYVEAHMEKIFNMEDADDCDVEHTYRQTRTEFFNRFRKLGLYTLSREGDADKFLRADDVHEVECTISEIGQGTSLADSVIDRMPRNAHLVFAEYFAVECITELMKDLIEDCRDDNLKIRNIWQMLLNLVLFHAPPGVREAFDYKLQSDYGLASLANSEDCRRVVFELLMKDRRPEDDGETPITEAFKHGLVNIANLLLSSAQINLNRGNVEAVVSLLARSRDKVLEFSGEYAQTVRSVLDSVKNMDLQQLGEILSSGRLTGDPVSYVNDICSSETASELQRHVAATTEQFPVLAQRIQDLCQQTGDVGQTLSSLAEFGVKTLLDNLLTRLNSPEEDLD